MHTPGRAQASHCDLQVAVTLAQQLWWSGHVEAALSQYAWVADTLCRQGQPHLATSTFRMMATLAPYCVATQLRCAEHYAAHGAPTEAVAILDWAAVELSAHGRWLEAADVLARAVVLDPDHADRRHRLGDLYAGLGMIDAAVQQLHEAGRLLLLAKRYRDFTVAAHRLLSVRRGHVPTLRALAATHLRARDLPRTFDALRQLLQASRGDAVAGELMVEILLVARRPRAARTAAELVSKVLLAQGDAEAIAVARRVVARAVRRHPGEAVFARLSAELEAEVIDDDMIEVIEESVVVAAPVSPSTKTAWEQTGVFNLVAHAMRADVPPEELETNVFDMSKFRGARPGPDRASEPTRPDARGELIVGSFGATGLDARASATC